MEKASVRMLTRNKKNLHEVALNVLFLNILRQNSNLENR